MKQRVVVPVRLFAGFERRFKFLGNSLSRFPIAAHVTHGHRDQKMQMRLVVFSCADPERVFERVEGNVVAVVGVEVILVWAGWLGSFENNLEVAFTGLIDLTLPGPPV